MQSFQKGLGHGIPIALGYFSVSIGFGLMAVACGLSIPQAVLISMTNLTSAGQLAGVGVMAAGGSGFEMALTQLTINIRYALMSIGLSQKLEDDIALPTRLGIAFFNTDEIYAVSVSQPDRLSTGYMLGLSTLPYIGWALGTLLGGIAGSVLPALIRNGLGIAIYGMFLAIVVPPARDSAAIRAAVVIAALLSCALRYLPLLSQIPSGFSIVICAVCACIYCALRHPINKEAS